MPEAKPDEVTTDGAPEGDALDLAALRTRGDVDGILELAKAFRSGSAPGGRDMAQCLEAYRAATDLGSAEAEYAVALFCMTGSVVAQDFKEGTTRLRAAAEKGSVPAKVYLGNLYELGIHYKVDPEKADVWYRNAARSAGVLATPESETYAEELAELGCARHVLARVEGGTLAEADKTRLLQRARAHGYGLRRKDETTTDRQTLTDAFRDVDAGRRQKPAKATTITADAPVAEAKRRPTPEKVTESGGPTRASIGAGAFAYALLFAATGLGAAYAAYLGARELVAHGKMLPGLGTRSDLVFPIVLGAVGVLPTWLVYRFGTVLKALVIGAGFGGIGWVAWGTGRAAFHASRDLQALSFGLGGFLAGLLVLGLLGGTKRQPARARRRPPS